MRIKILLTVISILLLEASSFAQDNNWQLVLTNGDTISNISLRELEGDSVAIECSNVALTKWIQVDSIAQLRKINKSRFWRGAGIGILVGTAAGALIGLATYEEPTPSPHKWNFDFGPEWNAMGGGIVGGLTGFALGGFIGAALGKDEVYRISQMQKMQKINTLWIILHDDIGH